RNRTHTWPLVPLPDAAIVPLSSSASIPRLHELAPRPQCVVLAIALPQPLEGARMLPEIRLVEELGIVDVLALQQPLAHVVHAAHRHRALPLEIPGEG